MKKRFHLVSLVLLGMIAGAVPIFQDAFGDTRPPSPEGMVLIPAGEFERGSNTGEADTDEQPVHTVYVDAFYMDETEVTNAQYKAFLTENPRWRKNGISAEFHDGNYLKLWNGNDYPKGKGDHPVTHVSWHAAMAYAEWTGKRLPTEAEWERAARGGLVGNAYPHGATINPKDANYNINVGDTTAVGKYPKNAYGLYDMAGNVSEWCLDAYNYNFYPELSENSVTRNPLLGDSGETSVEWLLNRLTLRDWPSVVRGGSWACKAQNVRVSDRFYSLPTFTNVATGFRCVRDTVPPSPVDPREQRVTQGALRVKVDDAVVECPLKHTDVAVNITGFIARVTVSQTFYNPYAESLAGVYVFPLPSTATMDALTMHIGDRKIVGVMKTGNEAYGIYDYDQALQRREIAGLVEQKVVGLSELKYPNIFTQSVEDIEPHQAVEIEISYIDVLPYDKGTYEFHFPMVVGPRSIHVPSLSKQPDPPSASGSLPSALEAGYRTGDDIRLSVLLDAGVPIQHIEIVNHTSVVERGDTSKATVAFSPTGAIPNKDFVMKYTVAGEKPEMAVFAHAPGTEHRDFMFMIQPKIDAKPPKVTPREFVFLLNVSPEMSDESKAVFETVLHYFFTFSKPSDTFQVVTFVNDAESYGNPFKKNSEPPPRALTLFAKPMPATPANLAHARTFIQQTRDDSYDISIHRALNFDAPVDPKRVRIVVMFKDRLPRLGYDVKDINNAVGSRADDACRFWFIGFDARTESFLVHGIPKYGGGISRVSDLNTNPEPLVKQIVEHIPRAQLTNIQIDWKHLPVYETYPRHIPELWGDRPIVVFGQYADGASAEMVVSGIAEGKPVTYTRNVTLPDTAPINEALTKVWARKKIADLSSQRSISAVAEECTRIAQDYGVLSKYTGLVAVDERGMLYGGPVEMQFSRFSYSGKIRYKLSNYRREFVQTRSSSWYGAFSSHRVFEEHYTPRLNTLAKAAVADAQVLREDGHLEEARDLYRHASRLLSIGSMLWDLDDWQPVSQMEDELTDEILKKRAEVHPGLNQRLNLGFWNQPLASVIRTMVNASGFQLDLVPGTLDDIASVWTDNYEGYVDLRHATVAQGFEYLRRYGIRWRMKSEDTITIGAAHRMLDGSVGRYYDVPGLTIPLWTNEERELYRSTVVKQLLLDSKAWVLKPEVGPRVRKGNVLSNLIRKVKEHFTGSKPIASKPALVAQPRFREAEGDVLSALISFEYAVNTLLDASDDAAMAVFASPTHLLVYGGRGVHEKMESLLAALRDSDIDITTRFGQELSDAELAHLRALQTLTTARWKIYAGPSVVPDLRIASWEILAAALIGEVDREALKRLQTAWEDPRIDAVIESEYLLVAMRSLWCIRTAAQILPTDDELAALSQNVLSKVKRRRTLKLRKGSHIDYLGALYAVLALQNEGPYGVKKTLTERVVKGIYSDRSSRERLIAEALLSPSEKSDEALQSLLPLDTYFMDDAWSYDGDLIVLTCLAAKRRGGDVWRTFHEELSNTMRGSHRANGLVVVIVNRLAASQAIQ